MANSAAHYDTVAHAWRWLLGADLHYGLFSDGSEDLATATDALTNQMLEAAMLSAGERVLDVGCGNGRTAVRLVRETGCEMLGISPSQTCIELAWRHALESGVQAEFIQADGQSTGFEANSFDCIWVMESSHLMLNKQALMAECERLLRAGGQVVLCDIVALRPLDMSLLLQHRDAFLTLQSAFGRARMETREAYMTYVDNAGLTMHSWRDLTRQTQPTFTSWLANANSHREAIVAELDDAAWQSFHDACGILASFWDDMLGYALMVAKKPVP